MGVECGCDRDENLETQTLLDATTTTTADNNNQNQNQPNPNNPKPNQIEQKNNNHQVLATPDSSSDLDYARIEGVVAHEYFHNWTGNRVTCRDWFQLTLKEGLTVFRDQEFSSDMNSRWVVSFERVCWLCCEWLVVVVVLLLWCVVLVLLLLLIVHWLSRFTIKPSTANNNRNKQHNTTKQ